MTPVHRPTKHCLICNMEAPKYCYVCNKPDVANVAKRIFGNNEYYICSNQCIENLFYVQWFTKQRKKVVKAMKETKLT